METALAAWLSKGEGRGSWIRAEQSESCSYAFNVVIVKTCIDIKSNVYIYIYLC